MNESFEEFKNFSPKEEPSKESSYPTFSKSTQETTEKTKIIKEEINTKTGEVKKEKIEVEVKEKEKTNTTTDNKKDTVSKENKEEKRLIRPRNNYLSWILGAGLTGLIGVSLFYMFSRKKY